MLGLTSADNDIDDYNISSVGASMDNEILDNIIIIIKPDNIMKDVIHNLLWYTNIITIFKKLNPIKVEQDEPYYMDEEGTRQPYTSMDDILDQLKKR